MAATPSRILATCAVLLAATPGQSQTVERFSDWSGLYGGFGERGWGINIASQGEMYFISWLTYDVDGSQMWLVIPRAERVGPDRYAGPMYRARGPAFDRVPWNPDGLGVTATQVGSGALAIAYDTFFDDYLQYTYTLNGVEGFEDLALQRFGTYPACVADGTKAVYQGLWWAGPTESGWGLNVNHQGDMVFAIWLTFDADGRGIWVVMPRGERVGNSEAFSGPLYLTTGPRFDAQPWNSARVTATEVGQATLAFSGSGTGQFTYTLHGATQTKTISRQGAATRWTTCRTR